MKAEAGRCTDARTSPVTIGPDQVLAFDLARRTDGFGYSCRPDASAYVEGTTVLPLYGDDSYIAVELPFDFSFYGRSHRTAYVSTNGFVSFGAGSSSYSNGSLPSTSGPNGAIYALWDDLEVSSGGLLTTTVGAAPDRSFVIEWREARRLGTTTPLSFEIVLHENGEADVRYRDRGGGAYGAGATVGTESHDGTVGFSYSVNEATLAGGSSVRFTARNGLLRGTLTSPEGSPVAGAQVETSGPFTRSTTTDGEGRYSLHLPPGSYGLRTTAFGFEPSSSTVEVEEGGEAVVDLVLTRVPGSTLTIYRSGTGYVTSSPAGISCGVDCSREFHHGTVVSLTADPVSGSVFEGWTGACSGVSTCQVTMTEARRVTATFSGGAQKLSISREGAGTGTVTSTPAGIDCGSDCSEELPSGSAVILNATPAAGSTFAGWAGACSGQGHCQLTMEEPRDVSALFEVRTYPLRVSRTGAGTGEVTSTPAGIDCGLTCTSTHTHGSSVTLVAAASDDSTFSGWAGACEGTGPCVVAMDQAQGVSARFELNTYALDVTRSGTGSGAVSSTDGAIDCGDACSGVYVHGDTVALTATPSAGSIFAGWAGPCSGLGPCTVEMSRPRAVSALFIPRVVRPDGAIKVGSTTSFRGSDIYNTTALDQKATGRTTPGNTKTFILAVGNDGEDEDTIAVEGSVPMSGSRYGVSHEGNDVTALVRDGTLMLTVGPGAEVRLKVVVKLARRVSIGAKKTVLFGLSSTSDPSKKDVVKAKLIARS